MTSRSVAQKGEAEPARSSSKSATSISADAVSAVPPPKCEILGNSGKSLSLGTKCWLSIIVYSRCTHHIIVPFTPDFGIFVVDIG